MKSRIGDSDELGKKLSAHVSGEIDTIRDKMKNLEKLKLAGSDDTGSTLGEATVALMGDLGNKMEMLQAEIDTIKVAI